jgi:hypothetical protein
MTATLNVAATGAADRAAIGAVENARFRFGPLGITPSIMLSHAGLDTNVFNEFDDPKEDTTFSIAPELGFALRAGRLRGAGFGRGDYLYFEKYSSERSWNGAAEGRLELPVGWFTPWVAGYVDKGHRRVGHEIDLRARRLTTDVRLAVDARIAAQTGLTVAAERRMYRFGAGQFFLGSDLRQVLNHQTDSIGLEFRQGLTNLLTVAIQAEALRNRFQFAPQRDADSVLAQVGLNLERPDFVGGRLRIGYRKFDGLGGGVSSHRGIVGSVESAATVWGRTRVELFGERDIVYSFETIYPYYMGMGGTLVVTPRIGDSWDIQVRLGGELLEYQIAPGVTAPSRLDRYRLLGGGVTYYAGRDVRVGFDVNQEARDSPGRSHDFVGYTMGMSLTFGTQTSSARVERARP